MGRQRRQVVVLVVGGSNPLTHPNSIRDLRVSDHHRLTHSGHGVNELERVFSVGHWIVRC